jgi:hypothetical protein
MKVLCDRWPCPNHTCAHAHPHEPFHNCKHAGCAAMQVNAECVRCDDPAQELTTPTPAGSHPCPR